MSGTSIVNLGGAGAALTWGTASFFSSTGGALILGSPNVAGTVDFQNAINLGGNRTIIALNGLAAVDGIISGIIANGTGTNSITKNGTGTLQLSAPNTYTGATNINAGTLQSSTNGTLSTTSAVAVNNAGTTLAVNYGSGGSDYTQAQVGALLAKTTFGATSTAFAFDTTNGNGTYGNALMIAAGITKLGSNTLTLSGTNTYTGTTTVSAGTLLVNGGTSASSAVNVSSGATLGGNGTIAGVVTINNGGMIAPGRLGDLTVGSLLLNPTSTTAFAINGIATPGTDYDKNPPPGSSWPSASRRSWSCAAGDSPLPC